MGKRLIVAEKPSVGRDIANVLNCRENGKGCRIGENDVVTWAVGHLVGLCYPDELNEKYSEWNIDDLPIIPEAFNLKVLESGEKQFEIVKTWMNNPEIETIVCATDAGREGELIFRYIYQMAGCTKPVERLWISSLTYSAIKDGFENLKPSSDFDNLYESAKCRSEADWLIGMNGSRAFAIENDIRRLSVGRVMSPTLSILVQRELERRNFIPKEYCEVIASFNGYEGKLVNDNEQEEEKKTWFSSSDMKKLDDYVDNHSSRGLIASVNEVEEVQSSQLLYDLTSLQRDANRIYGMSSIWTLDTAQSLYERHKAITYPRTDSRYISSDIKSTLDKRLDSFLNGELSEYAKLAKESDKDLFGRYINNKGVSDHHAIIPTGEAKDMDIWSKQEKQIYDLISRRFIGMFLPDRVVNYQTIITEVYGRRFISTGEKEIEPGWGVVDKSKTSNRKPLPDVAEGDNIKVFGMRIRKDKTKPLAPHTEASLLVAMEHAGKMVDVEDGEAVETEYGIGTPATRAATIEKILEKEMAVRKGRTLIPTEYGIKLISILPEVLQSPEMTGDWEHRLALISQGKESTSDFMKDIRELTKEVVSYAINKGDTGIKKSMSVGECPLCGNPVREYDKAYYCKNKECDFRKIYKAVKGSHPTIDSFTMRQLLANGSTDTSKGTFILTNTYPYIGFKYAPRKAVDYSKFRDLINDFGISYVDRIPYGGGFWIAGGKHDELISDFIKESSDIGCDFTFVEDSKALKHKCGWCHKVNSDDMESYESAFNYAAPSVSEYTTKSSVETLEEKESTSKDVIDIIKESGFEYIDKRSKGGSLWIVAGEEEGKTLIDKCEKAGESFAFAPNGGRASKHRPAWYSL